MSHLLYTSEYYREGDQASTNGVLPLRCLAPESYTDGTWDLRTEVWMFGVLVWEIFALGEIPWMGLPDKDAIRNIQQRAKLNQPSNCPNEFCFDIMLSCWRLDQFARISGPQIITIVNQYVDDVVIRVRMNQRNWPSQDQVSATNKNMYPLDINGADFVRVMNSLEVNPAEIILGSQLGKGRLEKKI